MRKPEFLTKTQRALEPIMGNSSNHTVFKVADDYRHLFTAAVSSGAVTFVSNLPVIFFIFNYIWKNLNFKKFKRMVREPKHFLIGSAIASSISYAKYKLNVIDWGFFKIGNYSTNWNK